MFVCRSFEGGWLLQADHTRWLWCSPRLTFRIDVSWSLSKVSVLRHHCDIKISFTRYNFCPAGPLPKNIFADGFFLFLTKYMVTGSIYKSEWSPVIFLPVLLANTSHSLNLIFTTSCGSWLLFNAHICQKKNLKKNPVASGKLLFLWQQVEKNKQQQ